MPAAEPARRSEARPSSPPAPRPPSVAAPRPPSRRARRRAETVAAPAPAEPAEPATAAAGTGGALAMARITIDPVTRVGGQLRVEAEVGGGAVTEAWVVGRRCSGAWRPCFAGVTRATPGCSPQRICGTCTGVHALASRARRGAGAGHRHPDQRPPDPQRPGRHAPGPRPRDDASTRRACRTGWTRPPPSRRTRPRPRGSRRRRAPGRTSADRVLPGRPGPARAPRSGSDQPGPFASAWPGHPAYRLSPEQRPAAARAHARGARVAARLHAHPRAARGQGPAPADVPRRRHGVGAAVGRPGGVEDAPASAGPGPQRPGSAQRRRGSP